MENFHKEAATPREQTRYVDFNILVCGASGIGKTSFIDLFMM